MWKVLVWTYHIKERNCYVRRDDINVSERSTANTDPNLGSLDIVREQKAKTLVHVHNL